MTKGELRRFWFQVHKWIGILLAIVLAPLSLAGSLLVWHDGVDRLLHPARFAVGAPGELPPGRYVAVARGQLPAGSAISQLRFAEDGRGPVTVTAMIPAPPGPRRPGPPARLVVYLDPASGRVLDVADTSAGAMRWLHVFHGSLQIPGVGRSIVGWLGVVMLVSAVSGLWLWWPTAGRWTRGLRWRRARELDTNLHHLAGFWIALPLAMLSLTGAWISFPAFFGALSGASAPGMRPPMARPIDRTVLDVDRVIAVAGTGRTASVTWPTDRQPAWKVSFANDGVAARTVDDRTGRLADAGPDRQQAGIARLMRRLHDGTGMGPVWQAIIFVAGILPTLLGITGILMWLRTRRWRARARRRVAVAAE